MNVDAAHGLMTGDSVFSVAVVCLVLVFGFIMILLFDVQQDSSLMGKMGDKTPLSHQVVCHRQFPNCQLELCITRELVIFGKCDFMSGLG
jgi:hypothetical protein